jgi:hypothetical protein
MRTLRTRVVVMLAGLVVTLGLAGAASASSITMTWISTSGAGVGVGTSTLTGVGLSDTAVLQIDVHADSLGVNAVGVVFQYDNTILNDGAPQARCPVGGLNNPFGVCGNNPVSGLLTTNSDQQDGTGSSGPGVNGGIQIDGAPPGGQANQTFTFAQITFTAIGAGTTGNILFRPGVDGIVTTASTIGFAGTGASITVAAVPEPGTLALVGLGLGALVFAGRRRR